MTCREFIEFLMSYVDGEVSGHQRAEFDRHMRACPSCAAYLESYKKTLAMERELCTDCGDVPQSVPEDLVRAIVAAKKRS
ncbi:MAG: anti-sigma factor family protein [Phycisphaerales bacterium]